MHIWVPTTQLKKWNIFITFEAPLQVFPDPVSLSNETKILIFITCVHFSFKFCHMDMYSYTAYWWIHIVCSLPQLSFLHSLLYSWDGAMLVADCSFHHSFSPLRRIPLFDCVSVLLISSTDNGHLGCFQFFSIINSTTVKSPTSFLVHMYKTFSGEKTGNSSTHQIILSWSVCDLQLAIFRWNVLVGGKKAKEYFIGEWMQG